MDDKILNRNANDTKKGLFTALPWAREWSWQRWGDCSYNIMGGDKKDHDREKETKLNIDGVEAWSSYVYQQWQLRMVPCLNSPNSNTQMKKRRGDLLFNMWIIILTNTLILKLNFGWCESIYYNKSYSNGDSLLLYQSTLVMDLSTPTISLISYDWPWHAF